MDLATLNRAIPDSSSMSERFAGIAKQVDRLMPFSALIAAIEDQHQQFAVLTRDIGAIGALQNIISLPTRLADEATLHYHACSSGAASMIGEFDRAYSQIASLADAPFVAPWLSQAFIDAKLVILDSFDNLEVLNAQMRQASLMLAPARIPADFFKHTLDRLTICASPFVEARLLGSLNLFDHQLGRLSASIAGLHGPVWFRDYPTTLEGLNAPFKQQDELLADANCSIDENDTDTLTSHSQTAHTVNVALQVLELVTLCNESGKTSNLSTEFFKPTNRLLDVFRRLPLLSATDQNGFAEVVDCLYFLFYEGAGKDNLRFLQTNGGPLDDSECYFIWCIKHLRNKWCRHDADHGKERDIQRSWEELANKLRWLGLDVHPTTEHHFQHLQARLLHSAVQFLTGILDKLKLRN